jgi:hypothetical protein
VIIILTPAFSQELAQNVNAARDQIFAASSRVSANHHYRRKNKMFSAFKNPNGPICSEASSEKIVPQG